MRSALVLALTLVVAGTLGCDPDGPPPLDAYFQVTPYANPSCNQVDERLAGERQMRLFVKGDLPVLPNTQGLASYYHRHALSFFTETQPQQTTMSYALDTDEATLSRALIAAFPGVDLNDEQALMADPVLYNQILTFAANFILKPMVDFANAHSDGGETATNLILLPQLERPGGVPLSTSDKSLAGLAISPALLAEFARTSADEADLWKGVDLPASFTPMLALGNNVLSRARSADPVLDDLIVAHEFGHTGALIHTEVPKNLMTPVVMVGSDDCTNGLDDTQLTTMATSYGLGPAAAAPLLASGPEAAPARLGLRSLFGPGRLRSLLAGDRVALRSFVDLLFHPGGRAPAATR